MAKLDRTELLILTTDGHEYEVTVPNRALIDWDFTRVKNGWKQATDMPMVWLTFLAWRTLIYREAIPADQDFQTFRETICEHIQKLGDDDEDEGVDPSQPALELGSVSLLPAQQE